jgi:hypothetical protein
MSRLVLKLSENLRRKPIVVLIVFLCWVGLAIVALRAGVEDYLTSVYGYQLLPTRKTDPSLAWFVGALPQLLQITFGFIAIEKRSRPATVIALIAFVADAFADIYYKVAGVSADPLWLYTTALFETTVLFTLGSEFLLIAALENIFEYLSDAVAAVIVVSQQLMDVTRKLLDSTLNLVLGENVRTSDMPDPNRRME